jgi:hypothetical protein
MGRGVHQIIELLKFSTRLGVLRKKGSSYWFDGGDQGDVCVGRGRDAAVMALAKNQALLDEVVNRAVRALRG